jgi:hypothetical protein
MRACAGTITSCEYCRTADGVPTLRIGYLKMGSISEPAAQERIREISGSGLSIFTLVSPDVSLCCRAA